MAFARSSYDPTEATQLSASARADIVPRDGDDHENLSRTAMMQAVIYGLPSVYQYASMCSTSAPKTPADPWRLNTFAHDRRIADSTYKAFRVPNVDTLYSNGWLDLADGPVFIDLPSFGERYYTLQLLDAYSNVSNISSRTYSDAPQRFAVMTTDWQGPTPADVEVFRVATPLMWVLMRIQVFDTGDLPVVHKLQDEVTISTDHAVTTNRSWPIIHQEEVETSWQSFLSALDTSLRINGHPRTDQSHVQQFRILGISNPDISSSGLRELDAAAARGAAQGFSDAMSLLARSRPQLGEPIGSGWTRVLDKGTHGDNFLARAVMNFVGLGANVVDENCSYNTYYDRNRDQLNGSDHSYQIHLTDPPPAKAFWSITLYDLNGWLYAAPAGKHSVGTSGREEDAAAYPMTITISNERPAVGEWLPCPAGPFFIALRMYQPKNCALHGEWTPPPVHIVSDPTH
jgi:hypothetical protein